MTIMEHVSIKTLYASPVLYAALYFRYVRFGART